MTQRPTPELAAERALRLAAACGNGLLSGAVIEVITEAGATDHAAPGHAAPGHAAPDHAAARVLRSALSRMGARELAPDGGASGPADYVFVTGDTSAVRFATLMASRLREAARLPVIFVAVGETPDAAAVSSALAALDRTFLTSALRTMGLGGAPIRWRHREPRAQIAEFRLGGHSAALAIPASQLVELDDRGKITESASRIDWAHRGMPATISLAAGLRDSGTVRGVRVGVSLVLEPKTAALALALRDAGAEVAVFAASNETDPAVATALAARGVDVFAPKLTAETIAQSDVLVERDAGEVDALNAAAILGWGPELLIDDGAHLVRLAHTERPEAFRALRAASEEATSGVRPLIEMAAEDALRIPVIAVNDARTKSEFDNRIGTGQSCVFAIADVLDPADQTFAPPEGIIPWAQGITGTRWTVIGYGPVGVGVARFAAALGAKITVVERDPVRALQALHDGYEATTLVESLPFADVTVSATGVWHTLSADDLALLRPGSAVAVAGGIDEELALKDLRAHGWQVDAHGPYLATWRAPGEASGPLVLADGVGVNYTAGEGNPIEVMDLSFATQLSSLARIAAGRDAAGLHALDDAAERRVAAAALAAHGAAADPAGKTTTRPGGAAQHWTEHRFRQGETTMPASGEGLS